ncbi:MAG: site-specific integrase [Clostridia bacterium]|nr:site-specific integrase [Clostridia bacterium]
MTIDRLPSGSYRIREMRNGKVYKITIDHKPTKTEARDLIQSKVTSFSNSTLFYDAADNYIKSKQNILSPATIRGYRTILNNLTIKDVPIDKITTPVLQSLVNDLALTLSPKTIKNVNGFIVSVLKYYGADVQSPRLPQRIKKEIYIPSEDDVKRILNDVKGTKYEVPFTLATLGLRRSEICALTKDDLKGNILTIDKALVEDENKNWIVKTTKTTDSTRTIIVPDYLADLIREKGIYDSSPHSLYSKLKCVQDRLGIQRFAFHKLRHFFASYMHNLGYSDKQIQEFGGWKTSDVLRNVYQHAMEMDKTKQSMAEDIKNLVTN